MLKMIGGVWKSVQFKEKKMTRRWLSSWHKHLFVIFRRKSEKIFQIVHIKFSMSIVKTADDESNSYKGDLSRLLQVKYFLLEIYKHRKNLKHKHRS